MKSSKTIRVILQDRAREEYETLSKVVEEQKKKRKTKSEEMLLLKSIDKKVALLKYNPAYGQSVFKDLILKTLGAKASMSA